MKQLSEECIKAIEKRIKNVYALQSTFHSDPIRLSTALVRGCMESDKILKEADLVSKEDTLGFADWLNNETSFVYVDAKKHWYNGVDRKTTEELFNLYINQKK